MKIGIVLMLVVACPSMASAQYAFQLRPSPYRILSGLELSANTRGQHGEHMTRAVTPVSDRSQPNQSGARHDGDMSGGINGSSTQHY